MRRPQFLWIGSVETKDAVYLVIQKRKPKAGRAARLEEITKYLAAEQAKKKAGK